MNNHKLNILFVIRVNRTRSDGKAPLLCRLTYNNKRKPFSTGQFINPKYWSSKEQVANPKDDDGYLNSQLSLIKNKLNQAFLLLQYQRNEFDVNDIFNQYLGKRTTREKTVIDAFNYHYNRMGKLVGIEVTQTSVDKYHQTQKHINTFLMFNYKKKDYLLNDLKLNFLNDFEYYLKTKKEFKPSTVYKTVQRFRRIIRVAIGAEYIQRDPFIFHKIKKPKKEVVYLNQDELKMLENYQFSQQRLQLVKDLFIFCCYTGLAFQEMTNLESKHIIKGFDGNLWIEMIRQKTDKKISIPLLPKAIELLSEYGEGTTKQFKRFPSISNQKFNSYLKEISVVVGIGKNLTHHIARKTFATTILLYNNVPMEIVSELLGHSKMSITQDHYGKVVQKKLSESMNELSKKMNKK